MNPIWEVGKEQTQIQEIECWRWYSGKSAVIGVKERDTKKVKAQVIENTKRSTLHNFIEEYVAPGSTVNTDDFRSYEKLQGMSINLSSTMSVIM